MPFLRFVIYSFYDEITHHCTLCTTIIPRLPHPLPTADCPCQLAWSGKEWGSYGLDLWRMWLIQQADPLLCHIREGCWNSLHFISLWIIHCACLQIHCQPQEYLARYPLGLPSRIIIKHRDKMKTPPKAARSNGNMIACGLLSDLTLSRVSENMSILRDLLSQVLVSEEDWQSSVMLTLELLKSSRTLKLSLLVLQGWEIKNGQNGSIQLLNQLEFTSEEIPLPSFLAA